MRITGLYKRGETYWFKKQVAGRRKYVSLGTNDFATAVAKAVEIRDEIHDEVRNDRLSLARREFLEEHEKEVRGKTTVFYRYSLSKLDYFDRWPLRTITTAKLQSRINGLDLADDSINTIMRGWRTFFNWCVKTKRLRTSPFVGLKFRSTGSCIRAQKACTKEERDALIKGAKDKSDLQFVLYAGFHSGLRKLEICEMRRDWLDLDGRFIHVRKAVDKTRLRKGEKPYRIKDSCERTIPISEDFLNFLRLYLPTDMKPLDFVVRPEVQHGRAEYRWDPRAAFECYIKKSATPWMTMHGLRHTFASLLIQNGRSVEKVAAWLGDDVSVVTKHYQHLSRHDEQINI